MIEHSTELNELASALSKAQGQITGALKDSKNPFYKSNYADLASVWDACRDQLSTNGLSVVQTNGNDNDRVTVTTMLIHSSGQWIRGTCSAKPSKDDAQSTGSVITYLRRYGLAAIVGVAQIDDDAYAGSGKNQKEQTKITPDPVDMKKMEEAVIWFKAHINNDMIENDWEIVQAGWKKLNTNEQMAINDLLGEKAPGSNRLYRLILKDYLNYVPKKGI
jgi:hypothetical protein